MELITLRSFEFAQDAQIAKLKLESEEIEVFLKDEMTVQVDPFASNAIGGVKLQVMEEDRDKALKILAEGGFIQEEIIEDLSGFWKFIKDKTDPISWMKSIPLEFRFILIVLLVLVIFLTFIVLGKSGVIE